jgi:hypothetical protein
LYVGLIHSSDAAIQHRLINKWFDHILLTIHDSNGSSAILAPLVRYLFLESMQEWMVEIHKNHPYTQILNSSTNHDKLFLDLVDNYKKNLLIFATKNIDITKSRRVFF